jgi:multidrug resistance efflux pump
MNRKSPRRLIVVILIALAAVTLAIWAAIWLAGDRISFTDDAVDVELIPPEAAPPKPVPPAN